MPPASWIATAGVAVSLAYLVVITALLIAGALRRGGRREDPLDAHDTLAVSRFTIPVSLIVPVARGSGLSHSISSLLSLNYPELEVIVVLEGSADAALERLRAEWQLEPKEFFYRRIIETSAVQRIYSSNLDPRLLVIDKEARSYADALNCGLSLARYRYVATAMAHEELDRGALLRLMSPALRDPANVLAATGHIERRELERQPASLWTRMRNDWQRIDSIRSWSGARFHWNLECGLGPQDAITVWRRDALIAAGGFATDAVDPELDMLLRLQTDGAEGEIGRVVRTREIVGRVEPDALGSAARRARLRQRALIEALKLIVRGGSSGRGRFAAIGFFIAELFTPAIQLCVIGSMIAGAAGGWFSWSSVAVLLVMLSFGNAAITSAALLLRGAIPGAPGTSDTARLLLLAPAEYALYKPAIALSRLIHRSHTLTR